MKIDIYAHILPEKYLAAYRKKNPAAVGRGEAMMKTLTDLDLRFRLMDRYPDVLQVLTISRPPLEKNVKPEDAVELARIANEELAEIVNKYPDRFIAAAACLPLGDMDAALAEADRAIVKLGLKGVQISTTINGEPLDSPKFRPLYAKMAGYNLPIWIHPETRVEENLGVVNPFDWPYETSLAMLRLVVSGVFNDYPDIKFVTHHCGGMVSFYEKRAKSLLTNHFFEKPLAVADVEAHLRKFYNDTALYGCTGGLMCGCAFFGADHILFGTDAPLGARFGCTGLTIDSIEQMSITAEEKEKIFYRNAINLLTLSY
jgi:uncharacterized protein